MSGYHLKHVCDDPNCDHEFTGIDIKLIGKYTDELSILMAKIYHSLKEEFKDYPDKEIKTRVFIMNLIQNFAASVFISTAGDAVDTKEKEVLFSEECGKNTITCMMEKYDGVRKNERKKAH